MVSKTLIYAGLMDANDTELNQVILALKALRQARAQSRRELHGEGEAAPKHAVSARTKAPTLRAAEIISNLLFQ